MSKCGQQVPPLVLQAQLLGTAMVACVQRCCNAMQLLSVAWHVLHTNLHLYNFQNYSNLKIDKGFLTL